MKSLTLATNSSTEVNEPRRSSFRVTIDSHSSTWFIGGGMLGTGVDEDAMAGITQEGGVRRPALEDPALVFDAHVEFQTGVRCHKANQRFRAMNIESIHDKVPAGGSRVSADGALDMGQEVRLGASGASRGSNDLAR